MPTPCCLDIHRAWIALGSNISPEQNLPLAIEHLARWGEIEAVSSVWQSTPIGDLNQADFCNAALILKSSLLPLDLKTELRQIESVLGRVRDPANKNAARCIDLDIVLFDGLVLNVPGLQIPDPEIPTRPFLAVPLAELDPEYRHPQLGTTLREIALAAGGPQELRRRSDILLTF